MVAEPTSARRVLITGGAGLVASHMVRARPGDRQVSVTWRRSRPTADVPAHRVELTDGPAVSDLVATLRPELVVHTAYSKDVRADIVDASASVASACAEQGVALVHLSSDVVFDGEHAPYHEQDPVAPINDYGRWKAEAEQVVRERLDDACLVRLSLVVASDPSDSASRWLVQEVRAGRRPTLFHDEIRCPIRADDLAAQLWGLVGLARTERAGIWHLPGPEPLSRLELGRRVLVAAGLDPAAPVPASSRQHPAPRPRDLTMVSGRRVPVPRPRPL